jgi:hypothetical protein
MAMTATNAVTVKVFAMRQPTQAAKFVHSTGFDQSGVTFVGQPGKVALSQ